MVAVFTETCPTKTIFETITRKVQKGGRHLVTSGICDPRKGKTRQASVVRGESGGTFFVSDLPARPSRFSLPSAALLSTRGLRSSCFSEQLPGHSSCGIVWADLTS